MLAWVRHHGQCSHSTWALVSLWHLLGRGATSQLPASLVLFWCLSHPVSLFLGAVSPLAGADRTEETLLNDEFRGLQSGTVLALHGFWRFGEFFVWFSLIWFWKEGHRGIIGSFVNIYHLLSLPSHHFIFFYFFSNACKFISSKLLQVLSARCRMWQYIYAVAVHIHSLSSECSLQGGEDILYRVKICSPKSCSVMFVMPVIVVLRTGWPL